MTSSRVSSSGLSRGSSDRYAPALAAGWMAGTSPAMTRDQGPATGELVTTWEVRASCATEVKR
jgi:hypothetical protein